MSVEEPENWPVFGEVPSTDPEWLAEAARQHFENRANSLGRGIQDDHEVATVIDNRVLSVIGEHKKEIAGATIATLTVAGLLLARHHLRVHHKR